MQPYKGGSCPGYAATRWVPLKRHCPAQACLSNHFDRITLFPIQFGEALLLPKQVEGLHRASLEPSCRHMGPPNVPKFGRTCTLSEKFPH